MIKFVKITGILHATTTTRALSIYVNKTHLA